MNCVDLLYANGVMLRYTPMLRRHEVFIIPMMDEYSSSISNDDQHDDTLIKIQLYKSQ